MKQRKMAFYELDKGRLALKMQEAFEDAQRQAFIHGAAATVTLKIAVTPPKSRNDNFGAAQYAIGKSLPTTKSMLMTTQLSPDGLIFEDGTSVTDILQEELQFEGTATIHKIKEV